MGEDSKIRGEILKGSSNLDWELRSWLLRSIFNNDFTDFMNAFDNFWKLALFVVINKTEQ